MFRRGSVEYTAVFHGGSADLKAERVPVEDVSWGIYRLESREGAYRGC